MSSQVKIYSPEQDQAHQTQNKLQKTELKYVSADLLWKVARDACGYLMLAT